MPSKQDPKPLYTGRYLSFCERDGWEFVHRRHPVVVVLAWTPDDELLLVEQSRKPIGQPTIELPAGLVGDDLGFQDEVLADAAIRELEEETGWRAERVREILRCPTSAGMTDEMVVFMQAEDLVKCGEGGGTASENITVHAIAAAEIDHWLDLQRAAGKALDPKIYAALYWLRVRSPARI